MKKSTTSYSAGQLDKKLAQPGQIKKENKTFRDVLKTISSSFSESSQAFLLQKFFYLEKTIPKLTFV